MEYRERETFEDTYQRVSEEERIRLKKLNQARLRRKERRRIQRRNRFIAIAAASVISVGAITGLFSHGKEPFNPVMPEGYQQVYASYQVERGDTIYDIAKEYYDAELYDSYYESFNDYVDDIKELNNAKGGHITPYQSLQIPALINEDNIFLAQINAKRTELEQLPEWVEYVVEPGDSILGLAYLGAGNTNEAYAIKDQIMRKNNLSNSFLRDGTTIYIVNPERGKLKVEIEQLKEKLEESLKLGYHQSEDTETKVY